MQEVFSGHDDINLYHEGVEFWYEDNKDTTVATCNAIIGCHSLLTPYSS